MRFGSFRWFEAFLSALAYTSMVTLSAESASAQAPRYEVTWVDNELVPGAGVRLKDLNEDGIVVGWAAGFDDWGSETRSWKRAIMYDRITGMQNLNELANVSWTDLATQPPQSWSGTESEWIAVEALGITETNSLGELQIAGVAIHRELEPRVFVLTLSPNAAPHFKLLKRYGSTANFGAAINDLGVVVGHSSESIIVFDPANSYEPDPVSVAGTEPQEISLSGTIVTRGIGGGIEGGYVITPGEGPGYSDATFQQFAADSFYGINDHDEVCGVRIRTGKGKTQLPGGMFRFLYQTSYTTQPKDVLDEEGGASYFCDVNFWGDVCYQRGGRGWVSINGQGSFNLDLLVDFNSPQHEADWLNSSVQPQGINDAGQIIIRNWLNGQSGALLTRVAPKGTTYESQDTPLQIPDNDPNGALSLITIGDDKGITKLTVNVNIQHDRPTDLSLYLVGPGQSDPIPLQPGANVIDAFNGTSSLGNWFLEIVDSRRRQSGILQNWSITVED